jgi:hypothetical protein
VARADDRHERLDHELVAAQPGVLARRRRGVLEAHGDVEASIGHARWQLLHRPLDRRDAARDEALDRRRDERRERARKGAHSQLPLLIAQLPQLRIGDRHALRQRVGVLQRERPRIRERQTAGPPVQQARAQLALQSRDLLRHRGLGERQLARGGGERARQRDGTEGQQAPRIQH